MFFFSKGATALAQPSLINGCSNHVYKDLEVDTPSSVQDIHAGVHGIERDHHQMSIIPSGPCHAAQGSPHSISQGGDMVVEGIRYTSNLTVNVVVTVASAVLRNIVPPPINALLARWLGWITKMLL